MPSIPQLIIAAAQRYGVSPRLAVEVAQAESGLDQSQVSPKGAIGVMQLMPATAAALGVDPYKLEQNIEGGVRYLAQQLARFSRDFEKALAAYNWGPERVAAAIAKGGDWLARAPAETRAYVAKILQRLGDWQAKPAVTPAAVRAGVSEFRGLAPQAQTILMLAAIAVGLYALAELWSE